MLTKVKVYFNNDLINVNNLLSYSNLYSKEFHIEIDRFNWGGGVALWPPSFKFPAEID